MKEILLTSSALILALLVLRRLFRKRISRRLQYALWGLVLLRLLVPANLPAVDFSVLSVSQPAQTQVAERLEAEPVYVLPVRADHWQKPIERYQPGEEIAAWSEQGHTVVSEDGTSWITYAFTLEEALDLVWKAGAAIMALWMLVSNLGFWVKLRRKRIPLEFPGCKYPVYLVEEGLVSPCLFGLFRPAIYLTPAALQSADGLRHVLAHEETHGRQLDPLWSLLRSVCLAVYWFDPLVWWAAAASREDCELACDEGALKRLGEDERIPYGQTLLRLIPVRRSVGGALITATTMTSDKRRLKERITRIAENRKMKTAALCAVLAVTAAVCVVTFTGCVAQSIGPVPLTQEELDFFNEEYFNPDDIYSEDGHMRPEAIRNMFLSSLYETPADIDLFELVYMGIPPLPDVEEPPRADEATILEQVYGGTWPDCATYEITSAELDALLLEYTGMTLEETNKAGLPEADEMTEDKGCLTYLEDYDTYYWCHGDTNYPGQVTFQSGEREGDLIRLIYDDTYFMDGVKCLTLRDVGEGKYQFVSNLLVTPRGPGQDVDSPPPDNAPVLTIPLTGLTPYTPQRADEDVYLEDSHHGGDHHGESYHERLHEPHMVAGGGTMEPFTNVLGYDGVVVSYVATLGSNGTEDFNDYYIFEETGHGTEVYLLARAYGQPQLIDLDGDGTRELVSADGWQQAQIFFQRDGELYEANLPELLNEHWKRWDEDAWMSSSYDFHYWDPDGRYLYFSTLVPATEGDGISTALVGYRYLYYDGTNLLLYKPERRMVDHVLWTDENLQQPELVQISARELAKTMYEEFTDGYGTGLDDYGRLLPEWDDYCVTNIEYEYPVEGDQLPNGVDLAVYWIYYEFHSPTPTRVTLAGGTYVDEDGWVGGFWTETSPYLVFQILEDGSYQLLENDIASDVYAGAPVFYGEITTVLMQNDLLLPSEASGEALFYGMECSPLNFTSVLSRYPVSEQEAALEKMLAYADSAGEYEAGKVRQFANAGYDFSSSEEAVIQRLKDLLTAA